MSKKNGFMHRFSYAMLLRIMSDNNDNYLTGKLLLAMPSIGDPRFDHAVIYICAHDENGAMGLSINQPAPGLKFDKVLAQLGVTSDIEVDYKAFPSTVLNGGPVDPGRGFLLHTSEFSENETIKVDKKISITGTIEALKDVALGKGPDQFLFILGYAGWEAGQLEGEIRQNAWLVCDPDMAIIFGEDVQSKWTKAAETLGFDPAMLAGTTGAGSA